MYVEHPSVFNHKNDYQERVTSGIRLGGCRLGEDILNEAMSLYAKVSYKGGREDMKKAFRNKSIYSRIISAFTGNLE